MPTVRTTDDRQSVLGRIHASVRVLVYAAILAAIGAGLFFLTPSWTTVPDRAWSLPFFALVIAFGLTEATALHVEIRKESHSLSLACIPLMFGLLYTSPALVLVAYVLGGTTTLLWIRKSDLIKVIWNTCLFIAQVGLAGLLVHAVLGERLPERPVEWLVPLGAVVAAELLSLVAVPLVIMAVDGQFRPNLFASVGRSQILAVLAGTFAVTALSASLASPYMAIFAFVPLVGVGWLLRSSGELSQDFRDLQQLLTFTHALANQRGARTLDIGLVELVQIMRSRSAGLAVVGKRDGDQHNSTIRMLVDDTFVDLDPEPLSGMLIDLPEGSAVTELNLDDARDGARQILERLGSNNVIAVRVLSEVDAEAVLFVCDRLGMRDNFVVDELRLFGSLAKTLSGRLSNDYLVGRLENQAHTDALTGLANRLSFEIGLTANLARTGQRGAVIMIDLDRFKDVNDSLGHETGDRLLIEIANRLRSNTLAADMVSRFGGDEFAVMLGCVDPNCPDDLTERADNLRDALTAKVELEGIMFEVGASVGAASWPAQGTDSSTLLRRADAAMYEAKRNQLGVVWYHPRLEADAPRRLDLYLSVGSALEKEDFYVHFQPKVSLVDGQITGAEALARWSHPVYGTISPAEFIPLVVQAGLIGKLTRLVVQRATEAAATFRDAGLSIPVAVNLTPRDLLDPTLVDEIAQQLRTTGLDPSSLTVEITEDAMVVDFDTSVLTLTKMRDLGIRVAIDDFGTGHASLQHLHRLPVDDLKIDESFVNRVSTDPSAEAIVRGSINLARDLGLCAIAEGIEDAHTLRTVARMGCREMQGRLVSRPVPLHEFVQWERSWNPSWLVDSLAEPNPRPDSVSVAIHDDPTALSSSQPPRLFPRPR